MHNGGTKTISIFSIPVMVAALGYFVDIYDLLLFLIVRVESLSSLGLSKEAIASDGMDIIGHQMWGLMIGGILWGVMGDNKGRPSVLFGSILLYSLLYSRRPLDEHNRLATGWSISWCTNLR